MPGEPDAAPTDDASPKWYAGIKLGPYTPAIDDQVGRNATSGLGPYEAMFGGKHTYQILPVLDVDRFLWTGSGQFGVGGSIGYMQKTAFAYAMDTSPNDSPRARVRRDAVVPTTHAILPGPFLLSIMSLYLYADV